MADDSEPGYWRRVAHRTREDVAEAMNAKTRAAAAVLFFAPWLLALLANLFVAQTAEEGATYWRLAAVGTLTTVVIALLVFVVMFFTTPAKLDRQVAEERNEAVRNERAVRDELREARAAAAVTRIKVHETARVFDMEAEGVHASALIDILSTRRTAPSSTASTRLSRQSPSGATTAQGVLFSDATAPSPPEGAAS